ncbi:putative elongation factor 1-gamma (EF-1-gamma) [Trypanosoma cruzi]|nr:putative elongation factor 1-gamma (EF-1-gamma) [Trypanosoma cruzi]
MARGWLGALPRPAECTRRGADGVRRASLWVWNTNPPQPAVRRHANLSGQREVKDCALDLDALRPNSPAVACVLCAWIFLAVRRGWRCCCVCIRACVVRRTSLSLPLHRPCVWAIGGAGRCEELSVGGCRLSSAHWGPPHTRGTTRQPLAVPGR